MRRSFIVGTYGAVCAALVAAVFAAFLPVIQNAFVYDDWQYIVLNPHVQKGLTAESLSWAFRSTYAANWHPITWLSHMADCLAFGLNPAGHHAVNIVLHAANVVLLLVLLSRLTGSFWKSAIVAAVFGLHPLRLESVAWVAERKDVLSMFFLLLTVHTYFWYVRSAGRSLRYRATVYSVLVLLYSLGLMSKPMLVSLPFVLLLIDYWPLKRLTAPAWAETELADRPMLKGAILEKMPLFMLSAVSCAVTYTAQHKGEAVGLIQDYPLTVRLENAAISYVSYLGKMVWFRNLAVLYPHPGLNVSIATTVACVLFILCATTFAVISRTRRPYVTIGWLWYLVTLLPVIGLVQVGVQAMADRYTYLPLIGISIATVWGLAELLGNSVQRTPITRCSSASFFVPILILCLLVCTRVQTRYWRNNETLYRRAIACTSRNYIMLNNLGLELSDRGKVDEAIRLYRRGLAIAPRFHVLYLNLGEALAKKGQLKQAIIAYKTALRLKPDYADAHNNLGLVFYQQGNVNTAVMEYQQALKAEPNHANAHYNLASALARQGNLDEAVNHLRLAIESKPAFADAHYNLGNILVRLGRFDEAAVQFSRVVQINPRDAVSHYKLGNIFLKLGKYADAIRHYEKALEIRPNLVRVRNNLAVALYLEGRYGESWEQVRILRQAGVPPHPGFVAALTSKMPEP